MAFAPPLRPPSSNKSRRHDSLADLQTLRKHTREFLHNFHADNNKNKKPKPVDPCRLMAITSKHSLNIPPPAPTFNVRNQCEDHGHDVKNGRNPRDVLVDTLTEYQNLRNDQQRRTLSPTQPLIASSRRNQEPEQLNKMKKKKESVRFGLHSAKLAPLLVDANPPVPTELFTKPDSYFEELQQFRLDNPQLFSRYFAPGGKSLDEYDIGDGDKSRDPMGAMVKGKYNGGYFSLNDRYFPCEAPNPYVGADAKKLFNIEDDGPVKISIPFANLQQVRRNLKPVSRNEYDPGESMSLSKHLIAGYAPIAIPKPTKNAENLSFRRIQQRNKRKDLLAPL